MIRVQRKLAFLSALLIVLMFACRENEHQDQKSGVARSDSLDAYVGKRLDMVQTQLAARGISNDRVLSVMKKVPRHLFVPQELIPHAYEDYPLPIGENQTISQPYIVALMTELLDLGGDEKVLEIGTGSGYQAAVLSELAGEVYSIEIIHTLAEQAKSTLDSLGYENVYVITGDGYAGLPGKAPFDCIIVTAAPRDVPKPLLDQLKNGGRMVIPVGEIEQDLLLIEKSADEVITQAVIPVRFVPMTGKAMER